MNFFLWLELGIFNLNLKVISIFWWVFFCPNFVLKGFFWLGNDFKGLSLIKLNLISFFIAYYLFVGTGWTRVASSVLSLLPVTLQDPFNFSFFVARYLTVSLQGPVLYP